MVVNTLIYDSASDTVPIPQTEAEVVQRVLEEAKALEIEEAVLIIHNRVQEALRREIRALLLRHPLSATACRVARMLRQRGEIRELIEHKAIELTGEIVLADLLRNVDQPRVDFAALCKEVRTVIDVLMAEECHSFDSGLHPAEDISLLATA